MKLKSSTRFTIFSTLTMTVGNLIFFLVAAGYFRGRMGDDFEAHFVAISAIIISLTAGTAAVAYFISSLVVDRILNPVRTMIRKVKEIGERRFASARLVIDSGEDELNEYAVAFNDMTLKLGNYIEKQKQFVSDASHELSTPITIINGHADMLLRWGKDDPEVLTEGLTAIRGEALRMNELVENLLFFARSDSRRQQYSFAAENMNALLNGCADEAQRFLPEYEIVLDAAPLPDIRCDGEALRRVFRILFDNAVKHGGDGNKKIILAARQTPDGISISLKDSGPGIPPQYLERIFDRFFRPDESRVKKTGGSGLGLAIAKEIIESHGGNIRAENDNGAVFIIELH